MRTEGEAEAGDATLGPSVLGSSGDEPSSRPHEPTAHDAATAARPHAASQRLGRYVVLGVLGRGGMGVVHEARDEQVGREVALKVLHAELAERHAKRLVQEARALAKLSHPHVVQVFEVGRDGDRQFIAMELVRGRTLREWQRERPPWRECVRTYLQAGRGLAAAHAAGIVHRDFKPGNCILDDDGRVRVLDFGLARAAGDVSGEQLASGLPASPADSVAGSLTRTGEVLGTLGYMPLEQLEGKKVDARSDQWSFCASLYEALYGERPVIADNVGRLALALERDEVRPAPRGSKVPGRLRRVLLRGLAKDPAARWPSMDALLAALESIARARRARWTLAAGGTLAVGLGAGLAPWRPSAPPEAAPLAVPDASGPVTEDGHPPSPAALELREHAEALFGAHRITALREHLDRIAPGPSLPDDPTLAAEVLLWRGRITHDAEEGAALLRQAHALAQDADVPSIEARAAGAMTGNMFGAHAEGVDEWMRLAWVAAERASWDRHAAIEVTVTAAHSAALTWQIAGDDAQARALLEFADATVGQRELEDDAFVAMLLLRLAIGWRSIQEHARALHWSLAALSLLSAVEGPEHPLWPEAHEQIGLAIHPAEESGGCEEALVHFDTALAGFVGLGDGESASVVRVEIAGCLRVLGQPEAALVHARRAADHWAHHPPAFIADRQLAHLLAGHLLVDLDRPEEARVEFETILALVDLEASTQLHRKRAQRALARLGPPPREREAVTGR